MSQCIIANYGDESIALIQWCIEQQIPNITVINVDTGWAAAQWSERVRAGQDYAVQRGMQIKQLNSPANFAEMVLDRNAFPSKKFQWCAGFLKGLAINQYLDDIDPYCEATLLFAKRRSASRANQLLPATSTSEYYNDRKVTYPILEIDLQERNELIRRAGFAILSHPSLECSPCIHAEASMLLQLSEADITKTELLEQKIQQSFYPASDMGDQQNIRQAILWLKKQPPAAATLSAEIFDRGCGSPWGCGE